MGAAIYRRIIDMRGRSVLPDLLAALLFLIPLLQCRAAAQECPTITITNQPSDFHYPEGCPVTFDVGVSGAEPLHYQWFDNGEPIVGATNSSYTLARLLPAKDDHSFFAIISNDCSSVTSREALVTLNLDIVPPVLLGASSDATLEHIILTFGTQGCLKLTPEWVEPLSNYSVSEGLILAAELDQDGRRIILTTTRQIPGEVYDLYVSGVADEEGNFMDPTARQFQAWIFLPDSIEAVRPPVSVQRNGNDLLVDWPPGSLLETSSDTAGPWRAISYYTDTGPMRLTTTNSAQFFRAAF